MKDRFRAAMMTNRRHLAHLKPETVDTVLKADE